MIQFNKNLMVRKNITSIFIELKILKLLIFWFLDNKIQTNIYVNTYVNK